MSAQLLIIIGSVVIGVLGLVHFIYVISTNKFNAYDGKVTTAMQQTTPVLTKETTMWRAWVGFNYSHSIGVLWIPLIFIPLAINHISVLQNSMFLALLLPMMALAYAVLAKLYWFKIPLLGSLVSLLCFVVAFYQMHM